jgi:hypothetical protein
MIDPTQLEKYLRERFGPVTLKNLSRLGEGAHGTGFLAVLDTPEGERNLVVKELANEDLGHIHPSDRAGVFLMAFDEYSNLPRHVRALDVLSRMPDGEIKSISGGVEYYLLMEAAHGTNYFSDIQAMASATSTTSISSAAATTSISSAAATTSISSAAATADISAISSAASTAATSAMKLKPELDDRDKGKIHAMASYLAEIHARKIDSRAHYYRKLRDTIGHGECLMGVFDFYPDGVIDFADMAVIEKKCIDWRARLKPRYRRLCQIHGDFHPGNILFTSDTDFTLLDRSRGPWGDPADDVTALTVNYVFFSVMKFGDVRGAYLEALIFFYETYLGLTGDEELLKVAAPFYAFRGVVVANPRFYPELTDEARKTMFRFINNVLDSERFDPKRVNRYLV